MDESMDELIREILGAPPPAPRATTAARNRLTSAIAAAAPARRSRRWVLAAAGAAAAATAVALLPTKPGTAPPAPPQPLSARDVLLAAAHQAATATETGRYWHVQKIGVTGPLRVGTAPDQYDIVDRTVDEQWIARDPAEASWAGRRELGSRPRTDADREAWRRAGSPAQWVLPGDTAAGSTRRSTTAGRAELLPLDPSSYLLDLGGFDRAQVAALPTDPDLLRELFTRRISTSREAPGPDGLSSRLLGAMTQLLVDVPAPPAVRAAAFTVLAGIPGMRSTGEVRDAEGRAGIGVELARTFSEGTETRRLVVDPATHLLLATDYSAMSGARSIKENHQVILAAAWTDAKPAAPTIS